MLLAVVDVLRLAQRASTLTQLEENKEAQDLAWMVALDVCVDTGLLTCTGRDDDLLDESLYRLTSRGRRLLQSSRTSIAAA